MKVIGLTGGIGSGKSTVSRYLEKKGFPIIDADKIAREIVEPKSEGTVLCELKKAFGEEIILQCGGLDRKALAEKVFSNNANKEKLDSIMIEKIKNIIRYRISECEKQGITVVFVDAPLLFESNLDRECTETWVVHVPDEERIKRVMKRDGSTKEQVERRINSQLSSEEKNKKADYVINNSGTISQLYTFIDELLGELLT